MDIITKESLEMGTTTRQNEGIWTDQRVIGVQLYIIAEVDAHRVNSVTSIQKFDLK